mgnify:CR=1
MILPTITIKDILFIIVRRFPLFKVPDIKELSESWKPLLVIQSSAEVFVLEEVLEAEFEEIPEKAIKKVPKDTKKAIKKVTKAKKKVTKAKKKVTKKVPKDTKKKLTGDTK